MVLKIIILLYFFAVFFLLAMVKLGLCEDQCREELFKNELLKRDYYFDN